MDVIGVTGRQVTDERDEAGCAFEVEIDTEIWQPLQHLEDGVFVDFEIVLLELLH